MGYLMKAAVNVVRQYSMRLTVRQIYYRLVVAGIIKNTRSSYNSLDKSLVNARMKGIIPFDVIEDRSREFLCGDVKSSDSPERFMKARLESLKRSARQYNIPYWLNQPTYVEVWVEKDALASLIGRICRKLSVTLAPCRGYPSLTFLHEAATRLRNVVKSIVILYFGDFDMRGKDIERYLSEKFEGFGVDAEVHRIALTRQQIETYSLPPQPAKRTDTMARGWIETHGNVAWELDALEPHVLMTLVEDAIKQHLDMDIFEKRDELLRRNRECVGKIVENIFSHLEEAS